MATPAVAAAWVAAAMDALAAEMALSAPVRPAAAAAAATAGPYAAMATVVHAAARVFRLAGDDMSVKEAEAIASGALKVLRGSKAFVDAALRWRAAQALPDKGGSDTEDEESLARTDWGAAEHVAPLLGDAIGLCESALELSKVLSRFGEDLVAVGEERGAAPATPDRAAARAGGAATPPPSTPQSARGGSAKRRKRLRRAAESDESSSGESSGSDYDSSSEDFLASSSDDEDDDEDYVEDVDDHDIGLKRRSPRKKKRGRRGRRAAGGGALADGAANAAQVAVCRVRLKAVALSEVAESARAYVERCAQANMVEVGNPGPLAEGTLLAPTPATVEEVLGVAPEDI